MSDGERKTILVSSLVSHRNQGPRVDITVDEIHVQLTAQEARDLVGNILQCVAAAESDAFIYHFITGKLGQAPHIGAQMIQEFRDYRAELEKQWSDDQ
jgi:hypothetical protein